MPLRFVLIPVQYRQQDLKEFGNTGILWQYAERPETNRRRLLLEMIPGTISSESSTPVSEPLQPKPILRNQARQAPS